MATKYSVFNKDVDFDHDDGYYNGESLTAKSDKSARMQAKKAATENGWVNYGIAFFRESDGCKGTIDE